jgi:hypothetical protein
MPTSGEAVIMVPMVLVCGLPLFDDPLWRNPLADVPPLLLLLLLL